MIFTPGKLIPALCAVLPLLLLGTTLCFALDPRFEIDTRTLRPQPAHPAPSKSGAATNAKTRTSGAARIPAIGDTKLPATKPGAVSGSRAAGKRSTRDAKARSPKTTVRDRAHRTVQRSFSRNNEPHPGARAAGAGYHTLRMTASPRTAREVLQLTRNVWGRIVAGGTTQHEPLRVDGENFSLSLDPVRYPLFPAADGGLILVDSEASLPPFAQEILREQEPDLRIVTETPSTSTRFFRAMLDAARFYSVEENFAVHFGADPKVTVTADFKIEKNRDSLLNNELILLNISETRTGAPSSLVSHLEQKGFQLVDLSPTPSTAVPAARHVLYSISSESRHDVVDAILSAFSFTATANRDIELDNGSVSGISLSVRADRVLETPGGTVLFSFSEANPVQYTLFKLLQLKGYQVVMIHPGDNFRKISEKVLSALKIPASYGMHHLGSPHDTPVDLSLSGFVARRSGDNEGHAFLTNVRVDPLVREIAGLKGYTVIDR